MIEYGNKLDAVKFVREASGLGLADAKTWVENYKHYDLHSPQYQFNNTLKHTAFGTNETQTKHPTSTSAKHEGYCNKWVAFCLCFFYLGLFGVHRFYEGDKKWGLIYLFTFGLFGYGWLFDMFRILFKPTWYPKKTSKK